MDKKDQQILDLAVDNTIKHVLAVAKNADLDRTMITNMDLALIMLAQGRNTSNALYDIYYKVQKNILLRAICVSTVVAYTTWAISNIVVIWRMMF